MHRYHADVIGQPSGPGILATRCLAQSGTFCRSALRASTAKYQEKTLHQLQTPRWTPLAIKRVSKSRRQRLETRIEAKEILDPLELSPAVSEAAKKSLGRAAKACRQIGWFSFWTQLSLSIVSAGIMLFSVAFTSQNGPAVSVYLTLFGIVAGFVSTFWSFGYTRLSRRLRGYLQGELRRVRKSDVVYTLQTGCWINILGMASTLLGLQATVGLLVAKTLTNATANPFLAGGAGAYNPVLALDVFLVQASTNTLLSHFASLLCSLYIMRVISQNPPVPPESLGAVPARA
ncbi:Protein TIC 21, chloroplastic [Coccomyxa sp. Obi]|nr:Protein TIC 21, chloroplastic [Coccomyxa sp. Obi]